MFFYDGCRCPVCGLPFSENDDIVACPQCGAPHHRDCWQKEGHCHFEDRHADNYRWERETPEETAEPVEEAEEAEAEETVYGNPYATYGAGQSTGQASSRRCARCGFVSPAYADFCSRCGTPLNPNVAGRYGEYAPFHATPSDPCGGVDPKEEIDGVPAEELASCVRMNTAYYLPRFSRMARAGSVVNWNWAAFWMGPYWLLFRKAYVAGGIVFGLTALSKMLYAVMYATTMLPLIENATTYGALMEAWMQAYVNGAIPTSAVYLIYLLSMVELLLHVLCGLLGNRLYMHTCVRRVRRLKEQNPYGYRVFLPANGGVSLFIAALGYFSISMLQNLVMYFFR